MTELGHIVLYVRNLAQSLAFYRDAVGLQVVGSVFNGRATVLSGGRSHHELLLIEQGDAPGPLAGRRLGLYHVGWKVGNSLDELRTVKARLEDLDIEIEGMSDHTVSQSLYLSDPDGNEVELFVDDPAVDWRRDASWLESPIKPLDL